MKVTESDLGEIMLAVFDELKLPRGGRISRHTIDETWAKTGLRNADVESALSQLEQQGAIESATGDDLYVLTDDGHDAMLKTASARAYFFSSSGRVRRQAAKRTKISSPSKAEPGEERRK